MNRVISMNSSLFLLSLGLLVSRSVKAARRTRASFERSSLYTCDFDSAPCLTMMVSPGGRPYSPKPHHGGRLSTLWCLESYLPTQSARYGFGEVRVATLALLIFTALSGRRSCGVVITKFSDHVVTFRSSPTVFADTPVPVSASTCILAGKPPRAMSSAATLLHLYRGMGSSLIARPLNSQPLQARVSRDMRRSEGTGRSKGVPDNKLDVVPNALEWRLGEWRLGRADSAILRRASRDKKRQWNSSEAEPADSKTEPSPVPACRIIRCAAPRQGRDVEPRRAWARAAARAAPTPAGAAAAVRRRWRIEGPARSPSWSVGPVSKAPLRPELRRFRWTAPAARPAAAAQSQPEARGIRRARPHAE